MKLRVAVIGCGKIADGHVEEIRKLASVAELVAVCDREFEMARQLALRHTIPGVYDDLDAMLAKERLDVVHIATPPNSHLAIARKVIDAGAHVLVEKPLTLRHADSVALIEHAERAGKKVCVGYGYHFEPPARTLRALMQEGQLGEVVHLEAFYGYNLDGPFGAAMLGDKNHWIHAMPGKLLQNTLDHAVSKITEFLPDDRPTVVASGGVRRRARYGDVRDELVDEARILIRGERVTGYVTFSAHVRPVHHFLRVYGTKNTAHVDYNNRTCTLDVAGTLPSALGRLVPAFQSAAAYAREGMKNVSMFGRSEFHFFVGFGELFRLFYDSVREGAPLPISHRDILRTSWMLDEVFAQVASKRGEAGA
ncbi:MAG: Gfo/Idh/MocA family protein [Polyangiaceae bacterium]